MPLHIVSWNLHGTPLVASMDDRLVKVAKVLLARQPDLLLFQEVWFRGDASRLRDELAATYEPIAEPPQIRRHVGRIIGFRKGGLLAFRRRESSWRLVESSFAFQPFVAAASKWLIWQSDGVSTKGIQRFDLEQDDRRIVVLNTHLQSPYTADEDLFGKNYPYVEIRREQIRELRAFVTRQDPNDLLVVVGDFNTRPDESEVYSELQTDLFDLTTDFRRDCDCGTIVDASGERRDWIDYVLTRASDAHRVRVHRMRLIQNFKVDCPFSDHHGLEVMLQLTPSPR